MSNSYPLYPAVESLHYRIYLRGTDLTADEAADVQRKLASHPHDIETRLLLLGFSARARSTTTDEHLLWLIEHHPHLDLGGSWPAPSLEMTSQARSLWARAMEGGAPDVFLNATASMIGADPTFAESALTQGRRLQPPPPASWFAGMAKLFEFRVVAESQQGSAEEHARLANLVAETYLEALRLERDDARRLYLLWPARQAAKAAEHPAHRLLQRADGEGNRARKAGLETVSGRHALHTAYGLLAIATGDSATAAAELELALRSLPTDGSASLLLAKELLPLGAKKVVLDYLSRLSAQADAASPEDAARMKGWASMISRGQTPEW